MKASWVKKGVLGKFVSKKQANIRKGKGKKKAKETKHSNVFQKGVDGQQAKKKWNFEREDTKNAIKMCFQETQLFKNTVSKNTFSPMPKHRFQKRCHFRF